MPLFHGFHTAVMKFSNQCTNCTSVYVFRARLHNTVELVPWLNMTWRFIGGTSIKDATEIRLIRTLCTVSMSKRSTPEMRISRYATNCFTASKLQRLKLNHCFCSYLQHNIIVL